MFATDPYMIPGCDARITSLSKSRNCQNSRIAVVDAHAPPSFRERQRAKQKSDELLTLQGTIGAPC